MTEISERFEVVYDEAGFEPVTSLVDAGKWQPASWRLHYLIDGVLWRIALPFPTKRQAELALAACERLGITPEVYAKAAWSKEGSGELRRQIMEMFPW